MVVSKRYLHPTQHHYWQFLPLWFEIVDTKKGGVNILFEEACLILVAIIIILKLIDEKKVWSKLALEIFWRVHEFIEEKFLVVAKAFFLVEIPHQLWGREGGKKIIWA